MKPTSIRLFIKPWRGWCHEVIDSFDIRGISYEKLDVTAHSVALREMKALSGQTSAPTIEVDGDVLADFGADELADWWREQGFEPK